jgi:polyferredoxin
MKEFIILILFLLFAALFGRFFCGKICPFRILQDWLYKIPFSLKIKTFKGDKILRYLKYVALLPVLIMPFSGDIESAKEQSLLLNLNFSVSSVIIFAISLLMFIILNKPVCKYLCPFGAIFSIFNLFSPYKYRIAKNKCIDCNKCAKVCNMNIDVHKTPNHLECIRCGDCKKACPTKAIYSGFKMNNRKPKAESPIINSVGQRPTEWHTHQPEAPTGRNRLYYQL